MKKYHTHLCLVSAQSIPNITPVLDLSFRPTQVMLLVSPGMLENANHLQSVMQEVGVKVKQCKIDDAWEVDDIRDRVLALLPDDTDGIALNVTGGTKPMSIAAYEVFRGLGLPIFYVHPQKDRVIWMYPQSFDDFNIENRIKLPHFLKSYGVQIAEQPNRKALRGSLQTLSHTLVEHEKKFSTAFGTLNYLAYQANSTLKVALKDKKNWRELNELIDLFAGQGLLELQGDILQFNDEEARFFINGGWLEHHVFSVVQQLRKSGMAIHDMAQSLKVNRGDDVGNELDVAFLYENNLFLIECKTSQFKQGSGADVLYKLDSLTDDLGGLRAKSMLVSYQKISESVKNRAKNNHIQLCVGQDLHRLDQHLRRWMDRHVLA